MGLLRWNKVYKHGKDELHRPPVVALKEQVICALEVKGAKDRIVLAKQLEPISSTAVKSVVEASLKMKVIKFQL